MMAGLESISLSDVKRFRDMPHRSANEALKLNANLAVRLSETAAEFVQKVAGAEEQHAKHLSQIVGNFRRKTQENLRKDALFVSSSQFSSWEALLDEMEKEAKACTELSQSLLQSVSHELQELTARKKQIMKRWFSFRDTYMARVDKAEDHVQKVFREYQDQWSKYAEALERGGPNVKDTVILHSYNAHNNYIMEVRSFNGLHDEFYGRQIYDMLDELQAIHEDLVKGFRSCMQKHVKVSQDKMNLSLTNLSSLLDSLNGLNAPSDISAYVGGQNLAVKHYPPPKCVHKQPELPQPKNPDTPPVDLAPLSDQLQLVDMTQAPLSHSHEALRQKEFDLSSGLDKLHSEYHSVKTLLDSYRENPALGDPNALIEELLEMRNKVRVKEAEIVMVRGKLALFTGLSSDDSPESSFQRQSLVEDSMASVSLPGRPRKTSEIFVVGRSHEFAESTHRMPSFCSYCDGIIQPPITKGLRCKVCKKYVHHKCQKLVPYCSGQPPVKSSPKFTVPKRISMMLTRKQSIDAQVNQSDSPDSVDEDDETLGGIYEAPGDPMPVPPKPSERMRKVASPTDSAMPRPPPRGESLDPNRYSTLEDVFVHNSFEDTVEFADSYSYCVVLFDYSKSNPNDMELHAGQVVELINTGSSDWWKGSTAHSKGYFPASYVQLVARGETVMKALYDFTPSSLGEMSLQEGQIVVMTRNDGGGWLFGKSGTAEGLFPANYVDKIASV